MGKQVNFWMLPEDEDTFLKFLRQDPNNTLVRYYSDKAIDVISFDVVQTLNELAVFIWNTSFPSLEGFVEKNTDRQGQVFFGIDVWRAPVIEYSRSTFTTDNRLLRGRIWAEMYPLIGQEFIHKGTEFEKWYDSIARWLRRNLIRVKELYAYMGPEALQWYQEKGGLLR